MATSTNIPEGQKRIWGRMPLERVKQLEEWALTLGMSTSAFISLAAWIGAKAIMRVAEPESMMSPEQWANIILAANEKGLMVTDEDGAIKRK